MKKYLLKMKTVGICMAMSVCTALTGCSDSDTGETGTAASTEESGVAGTETVKETETAEETETEKGTETETQKSQTETEPPAESTEEKTEEPEIPPVIDPEWVANVYQWAVEHTDFDVVYYGFYEFENENTMGVYGESPSRVTLFISMSEGSSFYVTVDADTNALSGDMSVYFRDNVFYGVWEEVPNGELTKSISTLYVDNKNVQRVGMVAGDGHYYQGIINDMYRNWVKFSNEFLSRELGSSLQEGGISVKGYEDLNSAGQYLADPYSVTHVFEEGKCIICKLTRFKYLRGMIESNLSEDSNELDIGTKPINNKEYVMRVTEVGDDALADCRLVVSLQSSEKQMKADGYRETFSLSFYQNFSDFIEVEYLVEDAFREGSDGKDHAHILYRMNGSFRSEDFMKVFESRDSMAKNLVSVIYYGEEYPDQFYLNPTPDQVNDIFKEQGLSGNKADEVNERLFSSFPLWLEEINGIFEKDYN